MCIRDSSPDRAKLVFDRQSNGYAGLSLHGSDSTAFLCPGGRIRYQERTFTSMLRWHSRSNRRKSSTASPDGMGQHCSLGHVSTSKGNIQQFEGLLGLARRNGTRAWDKRPPMSRQSSLDIGAQHFRTGRSGVRFLRKTRVTGRPLRSQDPVGRAMQVGVGRRAAEVPNAR